jgi:glutamate dehydrogenase (NADP+)
VSDYAQQVGAASCPARPWCVPVDVALPCATQNELDLDDAATLIANGVRCVAEGANMPSTSRPPGLRGGRRAVRAGQGQQRRRRGHLGPGDEPERGPPELAARGGGLRLRQIMSGIHAACVAHGHDAQGRVSYVRGANIAGFVKVADAMLAQGVL